jgi:hypothetical protein
VIVHETEPYSRDSTSESDCPRIVTANTFVKYGPVEIGGQRSICPLKSVSISRARARVKILDWNQIRSITDLQMTNLWNSMTRPCGSGPDAYATRNSRLILNPSTSTILKLLPSLKSFAIAQRETNPIPRNLLK